MLSKLPKVIEISANVATLVMALLFATILLKNYLLSDPTTNGPKTGLPAEARRVVDGDGKSSWINKMRNSLKGRRIELPGVDWAGNSRMLVLALSSTCDYCTNSAPLYQRLAKEVGIRRIAILPQPVSEGKRYLKSLGVAIDEIKQVSFRTIGVEGTPAILLVDNTGTVIDAWVGMMTPAQETEMMAEISKHRY